MKYEIWEDGDTAICLEQGQENTALSDRFHLVESFDAEHYDAAVRYFQRWITLETIPPLEKAERIRFVNPVGLAILPD